MISFKHHQKHQHGTYASLKLSAVSSNSLFDHISSLSDRVPKEEYHTTICYSRNPSPEIESLRPELPITAKAIGYEVFPTKDNGHVLVLRVQSQAIESLHNDTVDLGATSDYPEYKAHITLAHNHQDISSLEIPTFPLVFDTFHVEGLDLDKPINISKP